MTPLNIRVQGTIVNWTLAYLSTMEKIRCDWCLKDDIYMKYHDEIWGWPEHDDKKLFEKLCLDGAQAGLSWYTILIRTEGYRKAFDNWNVKKIVKYDQKKIDSLLQDKGIIRNKLKVNSVITNAKAYIEVQKEYGSFNDFLWRYVDHKPLVGQFKTMADIPATTELSDAVSKDLKKHGFKFVGSTIVYAFMQAVGIVDDHIESCWRRSI